jgi:hypothetical protein
MAMAPDPELNVDRQDLASKSRACMIDHLFPRIVTTVADCPCLVDQPKLSFTRRWLILRRSCGKAWKTIKKPSPMSAE